VIAGRDPTLVRVIPELTLPRPLWIVMHEDLKTNTRYRAVFDALARGLSCPDPQRQKGVSENRG